MGCTTSHDAFAAAASRAARERGRRRPFSSSSSRRTGADPAAVCRERAALIRAAADRRFALAAAHAAYFRSLAAVGGALRRFAAAALLPPPPPPSPVLTLPPSPAKLVASAAGAATSTLPPSPTSSSTVSPLSHSLSDDSDSDHLHQLDHARRHTRPPATEPASSPTPRTHHHHHYMRNSGTVPRVAYENPYAQYAQGETSYGYPYGPAGEVVADERPPPLPPSPPVADASPWAFFDPFIPYDQFLEDYSCGGDGGGNLPTGSPNYSEVRRMEGIPELEDEAALAAEASKPSTSAVEEDRSVKGKSHAVPIRTNAGSKGESSDGKLPRKGSGANGDGEKPVLVSRNDSVPSNASSKSKKGGKSDTASLKGAVSGEIDGGSSTGGKKKGVAFDGGDDIVNADGSGGSHDKSVQSAVATSSSESLSSPLHDGNVMEAMEEVKERFDEALNCGAEVSRMLEVGKMPHRTTPRVLRYLSSRVVDPLSLTVPSTYCLPKHHSRLSSSKAGTSASSVNSRRNNNGDLSSTLEKLCVWEKKLYQEIKDEENLRTLYEKKYKRLKSLDERGAEPDVIDSTRLSVRSLRSRIAINIRTANAFSSKIEKIRDEELYPQLVNLIRGLRRMWKEVLECHEKQLLALKGSRINMLKALTISQSSAAAMATLELERELTKWYRCFNKWISSQRSFVEALNGWLKKWFPEVQQEQDTPDGVPPFSPGKLGAQPIFIISNDWFRAIDVVPKNDALKAIDHFSKLVHELKKIQEGEHRQKRRADHASRDYNRRREVLQRELGVSTSAEMVAVMEDAPPRHDGRVIELQKARKIRENERARHGEVVKHVHLAAAATLPVGLVPMLEQMASFFQGNLQVYKSIRIKGN